MKLLIISPSHVQGGVESYALKIAKAAKLRGWAIHAAFPKLPETEALISEFENVGAVYHPLDILDEGQKRKAPKEHVRRFFRTLSLLNRLKPDIVQINVPWLTKGLSSIVACGYLRIPTQVVFHLAPKTICLSSFSRKFGLWSEKRNQDWVAVSEHNRKTVSESYGLADSNVGVIYNGIRLPEKGEWTTERNAVRSKVLHELGLSKEHRILLTVGRLSRQKGYQDLVEVAEKLRENFPQVIFLWAGEGELRPFLEVEIRKRALEKTILMLGHRNDVSDLFRASDLFVFPSHFEGFPFALLEAMSFQTPFVATNSCGVSELAEHRVHGLLCRKGDSDDLTRTIFWALEHPKAMQEMTEKAYAHVQRFSEERMLQTVLCRLEMLSATVSYV